MANTYWLKMSLPDRDSGHCDYLGAIMTAVPGFDEPHTVAEVGDEEEAREVLRLLNSHAVLLAVVRELAETPWPQIAIRALQRKAVAAIAELLPPK